MPSRQTFLIISALFVIVLIGALITFYSFETPHLGHQAGTTDHEHPVATKPLKTKFEAPKAYDVDAVYQTIERDCQGTPSCLSKALVGITEVHGPTASLGVFHLLQDRGRIKTAVDDHHIAHEIGMKTAERFGINGQAFLLCPTSFNYGCQHGFFQYGLGKAGTPEKAAVLICGSLDNSYSAKFKFYCYHGLGHGVMMAKNYDLKEALATCDTLEAAEGPAGCWQGVFMENVNAGMRGDSRPTSFSETDPLAPCNAVTEKYRHECFINHAGWLMKYFRNDLRKAASSCLRAPDAHVSPCLQSIGLMVSNPVWQANFRPAGEKDKKRFEEIAWDLCTRFPKNHYDQCVIGAVDNILNFDELDISRAGRFCDAVGNAYKNLCYYRVGISLRNQVTATDMIREKCATFEASFRRECLRGANL